MKSVALSAALLAFFAGSLWSADAPGLCLPCAPHSLPAAASLPCARPLAPSLESLELEAATGPTLVITSNTPPSLTPPSDQILNFNQSSGAIAFTVGDNETLAGNLGVTASSNNQAVVANSDIVLGGSDGSRTITITPVTDASAAALCIR